MHLRDRAHKHEHQAESKEDFADDFGFHKRLFHFDNFLSCFGLP